jgi:hypothetical protein
MLQIAIFQSSTNDRWSYAPASAVALFQHDDGEHDTSADALAAALEDESIPAGSTFKITQTPA